MESNPVLLSFGGNLGDVKRAFRNALESLRSAGFDAERVSEIYHSGALDCESGAPDFCNQSVLGIWPGSPEELLRTTQRIEAGNGRPNVHPHHVSRTLDIDIILMGGLVLDTPLLRIPHPEFSKRAFVLEPSAEIAPDLKVPGTGMTLSMILERFRRTRGKQS